MVILGGWVFLMSEVLRMRQSVPCSTWQHRWSLNPEPQTREGPPTLTVGPNGAFSDLKFTLADPGNPKLCPSVRLYSYQELKCSYMANESIWSEREGCWEEGAHEY